MIDIKIFYYSIGYVLFHFLFSYVFQLIIILILANIYIYIYKHDEQLLSVYIEAQVSRKHLIAPTATDG